MCQFCEKEAKRLGSVLGDKVLPVQGPLIAYPRAQAELILDPCSHAYEGCCLYDRLVQYLLFGLIDQHYPLLYSYFVNIQN